jgi:hypothetical protein
MTGRGLKRHAVNGPLPFVGLEGLKGIEPVRSEIDYKHTPQSLISLRLLPSFCLPKKLETVH